MIDDRHVAFFPLPQNLKAVYFSSLLFLVTVSLSHAQSANDPKMAHGLPAPEDVITLNPNERIWIDKKNGRLLFDGEVCLQRGPLELFICPWTGKLHESVIRVHSKPSTIHAGLLAIGGEPGAPVSYEGEYTPAHGGVVEILVRWKDSKGNWNEAHGQDLVRYRDRPASHDQADDEEIIQRAEVSADDKNFYLDQLESYWVPVHPAFAERVKSEGKRIMRPSRQGKQLEQLMILTDPRALSTNNPEPEEYYRSQFRPAKRDNPSHVPWIKLSADSTEDEIRSEGRLRARWEAVFPDRKEKIAEDKNNVLRPSPAGRQIEELVIRGGPLDHDWIFAGSHIVEDPQTKEQFYVADRSGEIVCVSNFPTAMIDLPVKSSSDNSQLGFEAATETIPAKGTPVRVIMVPKPKKPGSDASNKAN